MPSCLHASIAAASGGGGGGGVHPTPSSPPPSLHTLTPLTPPPIPPPGPALNSSSCRYKSSSSHGYSHTLQYFPDGSEPRPKPLNRRGFTMPDFGPTGSGEGLDEGDSKRGGVDFEYRDEPDDGCGRQRRCWRTANFEWMNIKRKPGNKGKFFHILFV